MRAALAFVLFFTPCVVPVSHGENAPTPATPSPVWKMAMSSVVRLEKADGKLVASGVIVSPDGYFLTKASEVPKPAVLTLRLPDGKVAKIREVRRDSRIDVLLAQCLDVSGLSSVKWNESRSISLGQWLIAPKDSPDEDARLGVMSAKRREIKGGSAAIGIRMAEQDSPEGVRIIGIAEDSPAEAAGLKEDDRLISVAGEAVKKFTSVHELIRSREPGDEIEIEYKRGGKLAKCSVRLASRNRVLSNWTGEDYANGGISIRTDNFPEIIQHDIPLGPADMGGPVFNLLGQAVAMNIARVDRVTTFALPMEIFWPSVQRWIEEDRHPPKGAPAR